MFGRCLFGQGPIGNDRVKPVEQGMRATSQNDGEIRDFGWRTSPCGWDLRADDAQRLGVPVLDEAAFKELISEK